MLLTSQHKSFPVYVKISIFIFSAVFLMFLSQIRMAYSQPWSTIALSNLEHRGTYHAIYDIRYFEFKVNLSYVKDCNVTRALFVTNWKGGNRRYKNDCLLTKYTSNKCLSFSRNNPYLYDITDAIKNALLNKDYQLKIYLNETLNYNFRHKGSSIYNAGGHLYVDNITLRPYFHIDITCNQSLPKADEIDSSVIIDTAYSKDGDTIIVWNDTFYVFDHNDVNGSEYAQKTKANAFVYNPHEIRYRIYRSTQPITAENIINAELVREVDPLSIWLPRFYGGGGFWGYIKNSPSLIPRHPIYDEVLANYNQHVVVIPNTKEGNYYYAVVKVIDGQEDYGDVQLGKNSLSQPIHEKPGPGLVLIMNHSFEEKFHYVNGPIERWYYLKWSFPERMEANMPRYHNYALRISRNPEHKSFTGKNRILAISLHCWGGWINGGFLW